MPIVLESGKLLTVDDGYLICPNCRRNKRLLRIRPETEGKSIQVFCRVCKTEHVVDIVKGECQEGHGQ